MTQDPATTGLTCRQAHMEFLLEFAERDGFSGLLTPEFIMQGLTAVMRAVEGEDPKQLLSELKEQRVNMLRDFFGATIPLFREWKRAHERCVDDSSDCIADFPKFKEIERMSRLTPEELEAEIQETMNQPV